MSDLEKKLRDLFRESCDRQEIDMGLAILYALQKLAEYKLIRERLSDIESNKKAE